MDINTEVGVVHDIRLQELRLYTDYGRCCRPLFIVDKQALRIKKSHIQALQGVEGLEKLHWHVRLLHVCKHWGLHTQGGPTAGNAGKFPRTQDPFFWCKRTLDMRNASATLARVV